jgi:hypothetical protein
MIQIIDPRKGDAEDDASSTKRRSLFALAGSLVAEISRAAVDGYVPDGQATEYRGWVGDYHSEFECGNAFLIH